MQKKTVVVFDFDGTLTIKDSFIEFIKFTFGLKKLVIGILFFSPLLLCMKLGVYSNGRVKEKFFSWFFQGMEYKEFQAKGKDFSRCIKTFVNESSLSSLKQHLKDGAEVYVVSASIEEWIRPFCESIGVNNIISTKAATFNGTLTGFFDGENCYGKEKVRRLVMKEPNRSEYYLIAYGDSKGDMDMFSFADERFLVQSKNIIYIEFVRYCIVGFVSTLLDVGIFLFVRQYFDYKPALICGYLGSLVLNYFLTIFWTFRTVPSYYNAIGVIFAHAINLFCIRMGLMWFFTNILLIEDRIAYFPTLLISVISNFIILRLFLSCNKL